MVARAKLKATGGSGKRRKASGWRVLFYLVSAGVLAAIGYSAWFWFDMRSWQPDKTIYPEQGAVIASGQTIRFAAIRALGGEFAYLTLGPVSSQPQPGFSKRVEEARTAGLKIGMLHSFDPCQQADPQSARFTRMVPRSADFLPPAIALSVTASDCENPVSNAAVESELMTLINQIESHSGQRVILKLGREFEERYRVAQTIDRDLWLERERARPDYAGRPWLFWSANRQLVSEASEDPIEWVVVQN